MSGTITLQRDAHVATLIIDNEAKRNAISQRMWVELAGHLQALTGDATLRCIVLRGAGTQAFGSGADIDEFEELRSTKEKGIAFGKQAHLAMQTLRESPVPTLAAIRGACVGGGLEIAACCDLRIASEDARFGIPIAKLGGVLAYPEMQALLGAVGPQVALELLLEGRLLNAAEACAKGLVTRVVPVEAWEAEISTSASRIAALAPLSARWHKRFIRRLQAQPEPLTQAEQEEGYACFDTQDFVEGYRAFLDKRTPVFQGK
ncbi:Enoyl-CoA hydratase [plant metagenome]|uniref:Enoyl-CoA hydratase n=1 Tax=plant metagenome TaxID=1297885 RepID=A0A484PK10_9ZZZZ